MLPCNLRLPRLPCLPCSSGRWYRGSSGRLYRGKSGRSYWGNLWIKSVGKNEMCYLPSAVSTTFIVFQSILKSSPDDQLSMYSRSIFIHSSKATPFRLGVTCQRHVMPGFMDRLRLCQSLYNSNSGGMGKDADFLPRTALSGNR